MNVPWLLTLAHFTTFGPFAQSGHKKSHRAVDAGRLSAP